jgi:hypothetical protein
MYLKLPSHLGEGLNLKTDKHQQHKVKVEVEVKDGTKTQPKLKCQKKILRPKHVIILVREGFRDSISLSTSS